MNKHTNAKKTRRMVGFSHTKVRKEKQQIVQITQINESRPTLQYDKHLLTGLWREHNRDGFRASRQTTHGYLLRPDLAHRLSVSLGMVTSRVRTPEKNLNVLYINDVGRYYEFSRSRETYPHFI